MTLSVIILLCLSTALSLAVALTIILTKPDAPNDCGETWNGVKLIISRDARELSSLIDEWIRRGYEIDGTLVIGGRNNNYFIQRMRKTAGKKSSGTEANPEGSPGACAPVHPVVGQSL